MAGLGGGQGVGQDSWPGSAPESGGGEGRGGNGDAVGVLVRVNVLRLIGEVQGFAHRAGGGVQRGAPGVGANGNGQGGPLRAHDYGLRQVQAHGNRLAGAVLAAGGGAAGDGNAADGSQLVGRIQAAVLQAGVLLVGTEVPGVVVAGGAVHIHIPVGVDVAGGRDIVGGGGLQGAGG